MNRIVMAIIFSVLASLAFNTFAGDQACTNQVNGYIEGLEFVATQPLGINAQKADWSRRELLRIQTLRASQDDCITREQISLLKRNNDVVEQAETMMRQMEKTAKKP